MPRSTEVARNIAYPQLDRDQLDVIIDALVFCDRNRRPTSATPKLEATMAYLVGFYTRRWGLPLILGGRHRGQAAAAGPPPPPSGH